MELAQRITGMNANAFVSAELPNVRSASGVTYPPSQVVIRQNIRAATKRIVGPEDLNSKRRNLVKNIPSALKIK